MPIKKDLNKLRAGEIINDFIGSGCLVYVQNETKNDLLEVIEVIEVTTEDSFGKLYAHVEGSGIPILLSGKNLVVAGRTISNLSGLKEVARDTIYRNIIENTDEYELGII